MKKTAQSENSKQTFYGNYSPEAIFYPERVDELSAVFKAAEREERQILIQGNGTQAHLGNTIQPYQWVVSLAKLNQEIAHDIPNFTVTIQSGVKLTDLQKTLKKNNQTLPLDPPGLENATIGGIVATNASGPIRHLYGTCKDLILGMEFILPTGIRAKTGGKTMKNVAGYDLSKLFIGSMGTLGAITHVTFRIFPLAEKSATFKIEFDDLKSCINFIHSLLTLKLCFTSIELLNAEAMQHICTNEVPSTKYTAVIRLEGNEKLIQCSVDTIKKETALNSSKQLIGMEQNFWLNYNRSSVFSNEENSLIRLKISIPISNILDGIVLLNHYLAPVSIICHTGNGIIFAACRFDQVKYLQQILTDMRIKLARLGGLLILEKIPAEFKKIIDVWGASEINLSIHQKIKKLFDPRNVLAHGRFVGGI